MKELIRGKGTDPKVIWKILKDHHQQKKPTSRYAALGELLGIRKEKDELLPSVCMRVMLVYVLFHCCLLSLFAFSLFASYLVSLTAPGERFAKL